MERRTPEIWSLHSTVYTGSYFISLLVRNENARSLMIFAIFSCIISTEVLAEDLFEVTSCYFPIDFTPVRTSV